MVISLASGFALAVSGPQSGAALLLSTIALGVLLVGRRSFQREPEPRGVGLAVCALIVAVPVFVTTSFPVFLPILLRLFS